MAIARDSGPTSASATSTTLTFAFTNTAGDGLIVGVTGDTVADDVTGVTWGGVAMTLVDKIQVPSNRYIYLFYKTNAATGTANIVVTASTSHLLIGFAESYSGTNTTEMKDASGKNTSTASATLAVSATVVASDCWLAGFFNTTADNGMTAGTGTSLLGAPSDRNLADSNGAVSTGAQTLNIDVSGGTLNNAGVIMSIAPAAGAAVVTRRRDLTLLAAG